MQIQFFGLNMKGPEGRNDSQVVIVDHHVPPKYHFAVNRETLSMPFTNYVESHKKVESTELLASEKIRVANYDGVEFKRKYVGNGHSLIQWQALLNKDNEAWAVTYTVPEADEGTQRALWTQMLQSMKWEK